MEVVPFRPHPGTEDCEVNVAPVRNGYGKYTVEVINYDGDGGVLQAHFLPPHAKERADAYAAWLRLVQQKGESR